MAVVTPRACGGQRCERLGRPPGSLERLDCTPLLPPTPDEYTSDVLPASLVAAAKEEEVAAMEGIWDVWDVVPMAEAWRATGRKPIGGWV